MLVTHLYLPEIRFVFLSISLPYPCPKHAPLHCCITPTLPYRTAEVSLDPSEVASSGRQCFHSLFEWLDSRLLGAYCTLAVVVRHEWSLLASLWKAGGQLLAIANGCTLSGKLAYIHVARYGQDLKCYT